MSFFQHTAPNPGIANTWHTHYQHPSSVHRSDCQRTRASYLTSLAALQNPPQHRALGNLSPRIRVDNVTTNCPNPNPNPTYLRKSENDAERRSSQSHIRSPNNATGYGLGRKWRKSQLFQSNRKGIIESLQRRKHWV